MFNKILAAVDRSDMSIKVFEQALSLAKITSANLMLLHILSQEEEGSPEALIYPNIDYYPGWNEQSFKLYQEHWDKFKNEGLQMLQSWSAQANTSGVNTEFTQNTGSPGRMICELATSWDADLIIMGRRGRSGLAEFFLGSVSNYVLHHAPCSVQIAHLPMSSQAAEVTSKTTTFSN
ncbi:universal stress protein [Aphanizomenon flos-aquae NRERC-008]|uniref:Universal stress protein n=1 Tax=Aphanizomenon flos-aquae FACHB-1249 TaxID=2692889 RepID=A0ABR8IUU7_APHFL|nr:MULTISPECIES: universal stress protein [Aphanizomenon]MBD2391867.1 universal stress protein [Aphanizomenon flos-aquae FACHB-1171]MBD2558696.1 universal stress protein [Aphanizomenon flos-aquae FACHB-1290]MBD2633355.1 universal stress protein [Aphanizomenon sp. FACHB-1399]MBD2644339.1 universal stress protein [Aphanizomenon sp. FACHB-1401]MBD2658299.1 universal stress protein [Aphanizomenon flos-aquae FACHB-1265]